jgi:C_GCAxxG_C_C family probable redox protein
MTEKSEIADAYFDGGYNCAQSVLAAFCQDAGLDEKTALMVTAGFGGGMGRLCEVCGALTGGFMAIGLNTGKITTEERMLDNVNDVPYGLVSELARLFRERNGAIRCRELTGYDLSDPTQRKQAKEAGVFSNNCPRYIRDAVEILEEIL